MKPSETNRVEAFSDGVLAILITLLVLEIKVPHFESTSSSDILLGLKNILPKFFSFALSFFIIAVYWIWHHNMFNALKLVSGKIITFNLISLFIISIIPFTTALVGDYYTESIPVFIYIMNIMVLRFTMSLLERTIAQSTSELKNPQKTSYDKLSNLIGLFTNIAAIVMAFIWAPGALIILFISRFFLIRIQLKSKAKREKSVTEE